MSPPRTVIVLGMHRSGTSMVAGVLHTLGVNMGTQCSEAQLQTPWWSNPTGAYEDPAFVNMNYQLIEELRKTDGSTTSKPPDHIQIYHKVDEYRALFTPSSQTAWGWKDPQTLFALEYYLPLLSDPHFVICNRARAEISRSLARGGWLNSIAIDRHISKYEAQLGKVRELIAQYPIQEVQYRTATRDPAGLVRSLSDFLGLASSRLARDQAIGMVLSQGQINGLRKQIVARVLARFSLNLLTTESDTTDVRQLPPFLQVIRSAVRQRRALAISLVQPSVGPREPNFEQLQDSKRTLELD